MVRCALNLILPSVAIDTPTFRKPTTNVPALARERPRFVLKGQITNHLKRVDHSLQNGAAESLLERYGYDDSIVC